MHSSLVGWLADEDGDSDEVIGPAARFIATRATFDGLARGATSSVRREFSGADTRYTLTFDITRTD